MALCAPFLCQPFFPQHLVAKPSAGVAMFMALVSLVTEHTVRNNTAMTGEISLRGLVLPVDGIKEKVNAAHQAGIKRVMLPAGNRKDFEDIPEEAGKELEFIWLEKVDEAVSSALEPEAAGTRRFRDSIYN